MQFLEAPQAVNLDLYAGLFGAGCVLDKDGLVDIQCGSAGLALGKNDVQAGATGLSSGAEEKIKAGPGGLCLPSESEAKKLLEVAMGTMALQAAYRENIPKLFAKLAAQYINLPNGPSIVAALWVSIIEKVVGNK